MESGTRDVVSYNEWKTETSPLLYPFRPLMTTNALFHWKEKKKK